MPRQADLVRGRMYRRGRVWFWEVSDGEKVVFKDNAALPYDEARRWLRQGMCAAYYVLAAGHRFQYSYEELVDMVRDPGIDEDECSCIPTVTCWRHRA